MIFGCSAHHCRPANIDQFDRWVAREWIEVDGGECDGFDVVRVHVGDVFGIVGVCQ